VKEYHFTERGSDERQYCAPGIELPLCGFSRSKDYPEYPSLIMKIFLLETQPELLTVMSSNASKKTLKQLI